MWLPPGVRGARDVALRHGGEAKRRILYVPGGAFIRSISPGHWNLIRDVCDLVSADVLVAAYPLIPTARPRAIVERLARLVATLCRDVSRPRVVMGDSAGANVMLAATQALCRTG